MIINYHDSDDELTLHIQGRIDTSTSAQLRKSIAEIDDNVTRLVIDMRDVDYISSAGIRELLVSRQRFSSEDAMQLINVSESVYEILEFTGFDTIIPIQKMEDDVSSYVSLSFKAFLRRKVGEHGERVAMVGNNDSYTWEDIDKASQIIASDLSKIGVEKGTHVGLCSLNSINWVLTFFAIQKLGANAMLINPNQHAEEIAHTAIIGEITHMCYGDLPTMKDEEGFIAEIKGNSNCPIQEFYSIRPTQNLRTRFEEYGEVEHLFDNNVDADYPCVMIFTSGSTGVPKGVLLSAYNILNAAHINYQDQTLTEDDRTCLILPLFHIFGLVAGLFANAMADSVIYIPKDIRTDTLLELMSKEQCTVFHSVPTMLIALMNNKNFNPEKFASLRCTIISGAAATKAQIEMFQSKLPNDHFLASYGLSEIAPVSITPYGDTDEHVINTVGKPVKNINIKIRNMETGEDCEIGQSGEILVQGFNLMIGYYKVPIDQQSIDEEGWLRTGDLGFMDEEGYLHLSGRLKELIIRGGENIYPKEIEDFLYTFPKTKDVQVIGVPDKVYGEVVLAEIILHEGETATEEEVKDFCRARVAKEKVPEYVRFVEGFPMNEAGKIQKYKMREEAVELLGLQDAANIETA